MGTISHLEYVYAETGYFFRVKVTIAHKRYTFASVIALDFGNVKASYFISKR